MGLTLSHAGPSAWAATQDADICKRAMNVMPQVISRRREIHAHPEPPNREEPTAALAAAQLRELGLAAHFTVNESALVTGVEARVSVAFDYLAQERRR